MSAADKIAEARALICPLRATVQWGNANTDVIKAADMLAALADLADAQAQEIERLKEALGRIVEWSEAYPLDVFQEPDFEKVRSVLEASGMTLDAVSASNMRHVLKGAGAIARAALGDAP